MHNSEFGMDQNELWGAEAIVF